MELSESDQDITAYNTFHQCKSCLLWFKTKHSLTIHMMDDHGIIPTSEQFKSCSYCPKQFLFESHLQQHTTETHANFHGIMQPSFTVTILDAINSHMEILHATKARPFSNLVATPINQDNEFEETPTLCTSKNGMSIQSEAKIVEQSDESLFTRTGDDFYCKRCASGFKNSARLHIHNKSDKHIKRALNICRDCGRGFLTKYVLENHWNRPCDDLLICSSCKHAFESESLLRQHLGKSIRCYGGPKKCLKCKQTFSVILYANHILGDCKNINHCNTCDNNYETLHRLIPHLVDKHYVPGLLENNKTAATSFYKTRTAVDCGKCGLILQNQMLLENHLNQPCSNSTTCSFCKKMFKSSKTLTIHFATLSKTCSAVSQECVRCEERYSPALYNNHILGDCDNQSFKCNICGCEWPSRIALNKHLLTIHFVEGSYLKQESDDMNLKVKCSTAHKKSTRKKIIPGPSNTTVLLGSRGKKRNKRHSVSVSNGTDKKAKKESKRHSIAATKTIVEECTPRKSKRIRRNIVLPSFMKDSDANSDSTECSDGAGNCSDSSWCRSPGRTTAAAKRINRQRARKTRFSLQADQLLSAIDVAIKKNLPSSPAAISP